MAAFRTITSLIAALKAARHRSAFRGTHCAASGSSESGVSETTGRSDPPCSRAQYRSATICGALTETRRAQLCATLVVTSLVCVDRTAGGHHQPRKIRHLSRQISMCSEEKFRPEQRRTRGFANHRTGKRLANEPIKEIVIALGTDVEGDATSFYLAKRLARPGLRSHASRMDCPPGAASNSPTN